MPDASRTVTHEVVVIGGTNVDIKSRSSGPLVAGTSNPGTTHVAPGGVARNVAEVLARLGVRTLLVSAAGDDPLAAAALAPTAAAGVDVAGVRQVPGAVTGSYHAILDEHGDLAVAVSAMATVDAMTVADVLAHAPAITHARCVVLDANLPTDVLVAVLELAAREHVRVAVEPVSVAKATRVAPLLRADRPVALITPNADELAALTGVTDLHDGCASLHARGVVCVSVRLGERGTHVSVDATHVRVPTRPIDVVADVTGAGDAALGGHVWAELHRSAAAAAAARAGNAAALAVLRAGGIALADLDPDHLDALVAEIQEHS